jgi:hypothetical protein
VNIQGNNPSLLSSSVEQTIGEQTAKVTESQNLNFQAFSRLLFRYKHTL